MFGVISASYTDHGGTGGVPAADHGDADPDPPEAAGGRERPQPVGHEHRHLDGRRRRARSAAASAPATGWSSNGPFNLLNINAITFRTVGGTNGAPLAARSRSGATRSSTRRADRLAATSQTRRSPARRPARLRRARRSRLAELRAGTHTAVPRVPRSPVRTQHVQPQLGRVRRRGSRHPVGPGAAGGAARGCAAPLPTTRPGRQPEGEGRETMSNEISLDRRKFLGVAAGGALRRPRAARGSRGRSAARATGGAAHSAPAARHPAVLDPRLDHAARRQHLRQGRERRRGEPDADDGLPRRPELPGRSDRPRPG